VPKHSCATGAFTAAAAAAIYYYTIWDQDQGRVVNQEKPSCEYTEHKQTFPIVTFQRAAIYDREAKSFQLFKLDSASQTANPNEHQ
jgi:hypothetical protein